MLCLSLNNIIISKRWLAKFLNLRLALATVLNGKMDECLYLVAMVCGSFVTINKGTNKRYPWSPEGDTSCPSVKIGNLLANRCPGVFLLGYWFDVDLMKAYLEPKPIYQINKDGSSLTMLNLPNLPNFNPPGVEIWQFPCSFELLIHVKKITQPVVLKP